MLKTLIFFSFLIFISPVFGDDFGRPLWKGEYSGDWYRGKFQSETFREELVIDEDYFRIKKRILVPKKTPDPWWDYWNSRQPCCEEFFIEPNFGDRFIP